MEHTEIVTAAELEDYANRLGSESVIPELIWLLVNASTTDLAVCRIPYGDKINQPGWDGLVEAGTGFRQYMPTGKSYWEIGTGINPQKKATADFGKRTKNMADVDRVDATYVFVTPRGAGSGGWSEPSQTNWKKRRANSGWRTIHILDAHQVADWLREFPALGRWLLKKMGLVKTGTGLSTPAEHWENLQALKLGNDPSLPPQVFLVGRDDAREQLHRLFRGEIKQLLLAIESAQDAEDFIAAFLESLDGETQRTYGTRCLFINDADAWQTFASLRKSHVLVANPALGIESEEQLHLAATKVGHAIVIPVFGAWANGKGSIATVRSPSANLLETTLRENGFDGNRARELGAVGALNLAALKRHLRGLGALPPYVTWPNAQVLAHASLIGKWADANASDKAAIGAFLGNSYGEWIVTAQGETLRQDTPLIRRNGNWKIISRGESWIALGPRITDGDLDRFKAVALQVLSEVDASLEQPKEKRYLLSTAECFSHSATIRAGLAETLALLGTFPDALTSCTKGKPAVTAALIVRELLANANWTRWASLDDYLPMLAEASPEEFLRSVEAAVSNPSESPFVSLFAQESNGMGGAQYLSGTLWALESLAWSPEYLVRVARILADLAAIDPGGTWSNRPKNSLANIFLPWMPHTTASIAQRKSAIGAVLQDQPGVGWNLLLGLLPATHGTSFGTARPRWRKLIPDAWKEGQTQKEYWEQVSGYAELAAEIAANDLGKLTKLVDRLPDLPFPSNIKVLEHLMSETVTGLPEITRMPIWVALSDLAAKHRKFSDTTWALPDEAVSKIEEVAAKLAPTSRNLLYQRLFSDRDYDLYGEGDYNEQVTKITIQRQEAVKTILAEDKISGVLEFALEVQSSSKVGQALGQTAAKEIDEYLLPKFLGEKGVKLAGFVNLFVYGRYETQGISWVDSQLALSWNAAQKLALLLALPCLPEIWQRARSALGDDAEQYWQSASIQPWQWDRDFLIEAATHLISCARPHAALVCIYILANKKFDFPLELATEALLNGLTSTSEANQIDGHYITEVIQFLQKQGKVEADTLAAIEWSYLPLLGHRQGHGAAPIALERKLATVPQFFCELVVAIFHPDKEEDRIERVITEETQRIAGNAYSLLRDWRLLPGMSDDGTFDGAAFSAWLVEMKTRAAETGRLQIAMDQFGQVLAHAPADPDGLWIHKAIAAALDGKDAETMRNAFTTGLFNQRGVHGFTAGKAEQAIAARYHEKAVALENANFHRIAEAVRALAKGYERDASREEENNPFEQ